MKLHRPPGSRRSRVVGAFVAGAALLGGTALVAVASPASAAAGCRVDFAVNDWGSGFVTNVAITNLGDALSSWSLQWNYAGSQKVTNAWSSDTTQSGSSVTMKNAPWNGSLGTNSTAYAGFQGTYSGTNTTPSSFTLNGTLCNGSTGPVTTAPVTTAPVTTAPVTTAPVTTAPVTTAPVTTAPVTTAPVTTAPVTTAPVTTAPVTTAPVTTAPVTTTPVTTGPPPARVDNPFVGAKGYVNPEWKKKAESVPGGSRISNTPTAVWMDQTSAIKGDPTSQTNGAFGARDHLDEALKQGAGYIQFVVYNLPGRDCAALSSNGKIPATPAGMESYEKDYIDEIAKIQGDPKYAGLRIINTIEVDSLPNLVTNASASSPTKTDECIKMKELGYYERGISYALKTLGQFKNVYNYVDAAHHGWIGWPENFTASAKLLTDVAKKAGVDTVAGFIVNSANTSATLEPYIDMTLPMIRSAKWLDWNTYADEQTFAQAFRLELIKNGMNPDIGMVIDTSRNGWGGPKRPTKAAPAPTNQDATAINAYVDASRIDRRFHAGNWCNQDGAGLGERPTAAPAPGIDAYVWVKPPGESDGASEEIPNDEGRKADGMCNPTYKGNPRNGNSPSGAKAGAPLAGRWFEAQFIELMENAYPPLTK